MEKQIKYTSDGKKVVVVGSLNSKETIVQEIFVSGGNEIPSGENFVVKSLHDAPAVSWKEQKLKELEDRFDKDRKAYEAKLQSMRKEYETKSVQLREKLNYIGNALKNANEESFNLLVDFVCGNITHVLVGEDYGNPKLLTAKEFHSVYDGKLRLISLFGKDDGTFTYAQGQYYDWSGGHKYFTPFKNHEDAIEAYKAAILKRGVNDETLKIAQEYGITFPEEAINEYKARRIESHNKSLAAYKESIAKTEQQIKDLETL